MTYPLAYSGATGLAPSDTEFPTGKPAAQVALYDIKQHLSIPDADVKHDDQLNGYLQTALARISDICVPLGPATVVDTFDGVTGAGVLVLSTSPVSAVSSVTVYGAFGDSQPVVAAGGATGVTDGYRVNLSAGTLRRVGYRTWPAGWGNIVVTYTVGPPQTPVEAYMAVLHTVQAWWDARRLSGNLRAPGGNGADPGDQPDPTFGIPADAYELLLNYLKPPRVA
jgi:hypothetical protein